MLASDLFFLCASIGCLGNIFDSNSSFSISGQCCLIVLAMSLQTSLNLVGKTNGVSCLVLFGLLASSVLDLNGNLLIACFILLAG